jgi:hypothetical protein
MIYVFPKNRYEVISACSNFATQMFAHFALRKRQKHAGFFRYQYFKFALILEKNTAKRDVEG